MESVMESKVVAITLPDLKLIVRAPPGAEDFTLCR
jgi:hypothetical protein